MLKLYIENKMWWLMLALLAAAAFYAYNIRGDIKIAPKAGCGSCPKNNEDPKTKID
jgi:hypothetical protein